MYVSSPEINESDLGSSDRVASVPSLNDQSESPPKVAATALRVFAFSAGALDTTMQIGTIHALMLADVEPDVVLGVSAGAINAVALGEILTASEGKPPAQKEAARAGRFLQLLEAYRETPMELLHALVPDLSEVNAFRPLSPLETPVQFKSERESRARSEAARHGLINLINSLLQMRLRVSTITRLVRLGLDLKAAGDVRSRFRRKLIQIWISLWAWTHLMLRIPTVFAAGLTVGQLGWAWIFGPSRERRAAEPPHKANQRTAKTLLFRGRFRAWCYRESLRFIGIFLVVIAPVLYLVSWVIGQFLGKPKLGALERILAYCGLRNELGDSFALKHAFVRTFDPSYYGKFNMDYAVNTALFETLAKRDQPQNPSKNDRRPKKLSCYGRIRIIPVAANIRTLEMESLHGDVPVIDALMAATAMVPFFGAQKVEVNGTPEYYIDGANVANEPIREVLRYLQENMLDDCRNRSRIDVFTVTPFPLPREVEHSFSEPDPGIEDFTELTKVAQRGMALQRFRDAELEVDLMRLFNATLPANKVVFDAGNVPVIRAEPHRIEADRPLCMNQRIPTAPPQGRRALVDEAIAVGCFQTMKKLIEVDAIGTSKTWNGTCSQLMAERRGAGALNFPGSNPQVGPGISEICSVCRKRNGDGTEVILRKGMQKGPSADESRLSPIGTVTDPITDLNGHPPVATESAGVSEIAPMGDTTATSVGAVHPPIDSVPVSPEKSPLVACLFSGGVFRGVFQIGVANALQMLRVVPRVVAGASVGSITGALIAEVLASSQRTEAMRKLGATYLALDRLVLTDRLADFVRKLTLRAGNAQFSLRDIDIVFRQLERNSSGRYLRRVRRICAGVERVTYITPYEVAALARTLRDGRADLAGPLLRSYIQKMLNWYGVGLEALGAEPMTLLLREMVLRNHKLPEPTGVKETYADDPECADFKIFGQDVDLIAVTTNLRTGCMEVLKEPGVPGGNAGDPRLVEGLLASSAFPGVFRPQWSWEIFRKPGQHAVQFCDGGILDNLPFNAVVDHLRAIETKQGTAPESPHMIFTASLEPVPEAWEGEASKHRAEEASGSWCRLTARAKVMKHNKKIDDFVRAQREVQQIYDARGRVGFRPLNTHVIAVKPKWLCGTFGFHPMLGFRRENQAASIAHGCFSTFEEFSNYLQTGAGNHERIAPKAPNPSGSRLVPEAFDTEEELIALAKLVIEDASRILHLVPPLPENQEVRRHRDWVQTAIAEASDAASKGMKMELKGERPQWKDPLVRKLIQNERDEKHAKESEPKPHTTLLTSDLLLEARLVRASAGIALREHYLKNWIGEQIETIRGFHSAFSERETDANSSKDGYCWHLPGKNIPCPFAVNSRVDGKDRENFPGELARIYELCRKKSTHEHAPA